MRIPPAVAKEIGSHYAAAHANDGAAQALSLSTTLLTSASQRVAAGDFGAAVSDARGAVALLSEVVTAPDQGVAPRAISLASSALSDATAAIDLIAVQRPDQLVQLLQHASQLAGDGASAAIAAAADHRYAADELARQYM